jgi:serine/threonine protein kinase
VGGFGAVYKAEDTIAFGSPGYAAPEQYGRAQTTPRSDIYSLGAMLHQMLTGQDPSLNPFRFQPLSVSDRTLPIKLEKLIAQMLETDMQPDGHMIVSAEGKSAIQVWDARLRKQWLLYQRHSNAVEDVAWSPDGQRIASVSFDGTVHL